MNRYEKALTWMGLAAVAAVVVILWVGVGMVIWVALHPPGVGQ